MKDRRKGVVKTAVIVGTIAIGVFVATIVLYNPTG
ncbi:hypothetical protein [uncultured Gammaproteobacteria bacterium]|jgi:hypothetical protein|uniref:Uncharacterized protein n=3 Tax=sulfur-oxidizing symbionts TaxID=32036 RepID=A0A1H6L308_9GAMM|nr:hypothetical protein AZO1586I_1069 [Bathymodiolus thermophilus thioautotrophic gill symbiont]CAB5506822.1 hypothetical protein AZO1586R_2167 [Bathymodiolus azoricus thioautotrophic gill symbiont]CAC9492340.1 hypothetical protein [uncultured Gammaproteobacteria bacterium]SSC09683.1 hypothetical protein BPUTEOSOX_1142 [thiotrophic endosymbiont of Bathymodiolus puteoserpentis (Logatchev)]CAC9498349.1 hypothetical protein [uncultured Gammaproteobacteria bacterium]